jgi:hypothetical protein
MWEILSKKNIECSVNISKSLVAEENDLLKTSQNIAYFLGGIPLIMTTYFECCQSENRLESAVLDAREVTTERIAGNLTSRRVRSISSRSPSVTQSME